MLATYEQLAFAWVLLDALTVMMVVRESVSLLFCNDSLAHLPIDFYVLCFFQQGCPHWT
jgi:hypothetical protein